MIENKCIYIPGVFDGLHSGHIYLIKRAQKLSSELIIGVHTDDFVKSYKRTPINNQDERRDLIINNFNLDPSKVILVGGSHYKIILDNKVKLIIHGDDWELESYKKQINYYDDGLDKLGVEIKLLSYSKGISTTDILNNNIPTICKYDNFYFDLDNTLLLENEPMPFAKKLIQKLKEKGKSIYIISNNNRYTPDDIYVRLKNCDMEIAKYNIYTSLKHVHKYLDFNYKGKKIYVWGTKASKTWLMNNGIEVSDTNADVVVILYNNNFDYKDLTYLCNLCKKLPYICGNIDITYPDKDNILPDTGVITQLVSQCTNKKPLYKCGKPNSELVNIENNSIIIGDSLLTDKVLAENCNSDFIHVSLNKQSDISHLGILCDYMNSTV